MPSAEWKPAQINCSNDNISTLIFFYRFCHIIVTGNKLGLRFNYSAKWHFVKQLTCFVTHKTHTRFRCVYIVSICYTVCGQRRRSDITAGERIRSRARRGRVCYVWSYLNVQLHCFISVSRWYTYGRIMYWVIIKQCFVRVDFAFFRIVFMFILPCIIHVQWW